jgi:AAT family amino acid transporter
VLPGLIPWIVILLSQIQFRKQHPVLQGEDQFRMPFSPWSNYLTLAFLAVVVIFMAINPDTRIPLAVGVIFIAAVLLHYLRTHRGQ